MAAGALLASAWMLVPLLTDAGWTVNDAFSRGTFYYDSFGARKIHVDRRRASCSTPDASRS